MDLLSELNPEQKQAVCFGTGPLLIVAGAGTGKTTVITKRFAWLIEQGLSKSDEILALTFTEKAAQEMQGRLDTILPYGYFDLWISTFHSFCQRILEMYGLDIGIGINFKLLDETQQWILIYNNFKKFSLDYYRPLGNPTKFIHAMLKHFSRLKDEAILPKDYLNYAQDLKLNSDSEHYYKQILTNEERETLSKKEIRELASQEMKKIQEIASAYHTYQQILLENNALDFGDLINYCLRLLKERPKILAQLRVKFKYILVDEFQDTNWAQYDLIKVLSYPKNNCTVCADDDQSIYKFRGASVSNVLQIRKDFPDIKRVYLIKNYRSKQNILNLAYNFIQNNNPNRLEVTLKEEKNFSKRLIAQTQGDAYVEYFDVENQEDEANTVIQKIINLKNSQNVTWSDFAILVRANSYADIFIYALSQANIPYQYVASKGLYNKSIVLDILSWLKLLDNYHESPAMYRILTLPFFNFSHSEIIQLNYWAKRKGKSLYAVCTQPETIENIQTQTIKKIQTVIHLIEKHSSFIHEKSVREVILSFLQDSGYLKYCSAHDSLETRQNLNYLNQFYKKVSEYETKISNPSVKNFLHLIELEVESGEEGTLPPNPDIEGPDSVKIMTIHAAKGLEFQYVFIVNLVDRRFPTIERKEPIKIPDALVKEIVPIGDIHLQEERRLFYVACTRAKNGLFFTSAKDYGTVQKKKKSIFLQELGIKSRVFKLQNVLPYAHRDVDEKIASYKIPERFSFSQLKAYENCPWQYRYAFILHIPVKGKAVFSFGKTIHNVLQKIFELVQQRQSITQKDLFGTDTSPPVLKKIKEYVTQDEINKLYDMCFIDDWYKDQEEKQKFYDKGKKILRNYFQEIQDQVIIPLYLEKSFSIKISDDATGGSYSLFGVIDRVDEIGTHLEIIDYKTGEVRSQLLPEDKEQLLIYQLAGKEIFEKEVKNLTFYYMDKNVKQTFFGSEQDLQKLKNKIMQVIHQIEKGKFNPKPGLICKYCDFRDICEFKKI